MIRSHLQWWINPIRFKTGTSIHPPDPKFFLYTDASHYGWGAHLEPTTLSFHGRWTENQSQLHINMLEMMAIRLALKQAKTFIHHSCIMISTDNTTVVSYINKQGGTYSPNLCVEVWKILNWCLEQDIVIRVRHIPNKFNILADRLSRLDKPIKTEWALDQTVVPSLARICKWEHTDRLLCPVRALKFYLKMTSSYRQNRTRLFLPIKGNKDISKDTISRWISYTVKLAYRKLTKRDISFLKIKAHEVRALSSSWAFFDKVPLNDILQAAVWNSSSTFAKFYLRDMSQQAQNLQSLGPIVVAQKVVGGQQQSVMDV